eukprot:COSAG06_NODE_6469_length_2922_cov_5.501240_3_plen_45_part_00
MMPEHLPSCASRLGGGLAVLADPVLRANAAHPSRWLGDGLWEQE